MNNLIAMVRSDSSVAFVSSMGMSESDSAAPIADGLRCVEPPAGISPEELVTQWYYRDQWVKSPPRPAAAYQLDLTTYQWADPRTLQEHRDAKWLQVKQARAAAIDAPMTTPYGTFDCDVQARSSITDAILMLQTLASMGTPRSIDFTLTDNTSVTLTTDQMVGVGLLLGQKVQSAHARSRDLRTQINASLSIPDVDAIAWSA